MSASAPPSDRIDVGALIATIASDARERIGVTVSSTLETLRDEHRPLDEHQVSTIFANLLSSFDGYEREIARTVVDSFRPSGVEMWGLPHELEDLLTEARA